jgi:hypothetical protein
VSAATAERFAVVRGFCSGDAAAVERQIERYLPAGYVVASVVELGSHRWEIRISGRDSAGWTLDEYVLPRLASGLWIGEETSQ